MTGTVEAKLATLGITLPAASAPAANYVPFVISGNLLWISGQISMANGAFMAGKLHGEADVEAGRAAARQCAINLMAQMKAALGGFHRIERIAKLGVFVNSAGDFTDQAKVANGASDLLFALFGDAGRHARSAVGVPVLPLGVAVEIDAIVQIASA